jgi:anhydro-N-acetylmuramic acid kinase
MAIYTFFAAPPPKSLDRNDFGLEPVMHLETDDAAATLARFTVESVAKSLDFFPVPPERWLVAGGGRHNAALMQWLKERLKNVDTVEAVGWEGDALEAQAFAFLAVRSRMGLPISLPSITGVRRPVSGGAYYPA